MDKIEEKIGGIANIANLIYTSYIGRDFFAKIVPGFIGLTFSVYILCENQISIADIKDIPLIAWILILGVYYAIGFMFQRIGETFHIIRLYGSGWNSEKYNEKVEKFFRKTPSMYHRAQRERYVVIKEMYGNLAVALMIVLSVLVARIIFGVDDWIIWNRLEIWAFAILLVVSIPCLLYGNRKVCNSEQNWINNTLGEREIKNCCPKG